MTTPALALATYEPAHDLDTQVYPAILAALTELPKRQAGIVKRWTYYNGPQPQVWMTERFRKAFGERFADDLGDNYVGLAADAIVDRLQVLGFQAVTDTEAVDADEETEPDDADAQAATAVFRANRLDLVQEELWRAATVAGSAYLIVWPRETAPGVPQTSRGGQPLYDVVVNDARNVYLSTSAQGTSRDYAVKVWQDALGKCWRATVYYPDEVVRLRTRDLNGNTYPSNPRAFYLDPKDSGGTTPFPEHGVPVFRFGVRADGTSRLDRIFPGQDKINKLAGNKMVATEFLSWPQRYALTQQDVPDDVLRPAPGSFLVLDPGGNTEDGDAPPVKVGEFSTAQLSQYDDAQQREIEKLCTLAPIPRHMIVNSGTLASGAAITADEGPFVATCEDAQQVYGASLADLMELLGYHVEPIWKPAAVADMEARARTLLLLTQAGIPVQLAAKLLGVVDADDLQELLDLVAQQQAQAAAQAAAAAELHATATSGGVDDAQLLARAGGDE